VAAFEGHLVFRKKSPLTIRQYKPVLRDFAVWAGSRGPAEISSFEIESGFVAGWVERFVARNARQPSASAMKNVVVALRSFYKYLNNFGLLVDSSGHPVLNPMLAIEVPDLPQKQNDWLRQEEDELLLRTPMSAEEKALVWTLRWTGVRNAELRSIRMGDVDFTEGSIYVRKAKGGKQRTIPITPELRPHLNKWLLHLQQKGLYRQNGPLFPTRNGNPWAAQFAEKLVRRVGERAQLRLDAGGVSRLTPHTLRRTFGSYFLNRGVRLEVVSKLLGHSSTQITERAYAELLDQTIRREVLAALTESTGA
jgi:integrase/recombinase XerC